MVGLIEGTFITGTEGDDRDENAVTGSADNDLLYGLAGDDQLRGLAGNDILHGGPGSRHPARRPRQPTP